MQHRTGFVRWLVWLTTWLTLISLFLTAAGVLPVSAGDGPAAAALTAPGLPALVQPANGATDIVWPLLEVSVTGTGPDPLCVTFYGRRAPPDFTLAVIPDPQNEVMFSPAMFRSQTQWIAAEKSQPEQLLPVQCLRPGLYPDQPAVQCRLGAARLGRQPAQDLRRPPGDRGTA